jgi:prepilin signal peptidase PulO-like enzyme (type II secretory pathway)
MSALIVIALIVFGLIFGSFVNALVWRLHAQQELEDKLAGLKAEPVVKATIKNQRLKQERLEKEHREKSIAHGRSLCSKCSHPLAIIDLIPFFSWLFLRGKCRYCHQPIEDSGLTDLLVPVLFILSYIFWPQPFHGYGLFSFALWLVFLVGFVALAVYDIRWFILPDKIVWPLVALALVQVVVHVIVFDGGRATVASALWGVAIGSGVFLALYATAERLKREWIGFGDVKLGIALGLIVGGPLEALMLLYLASLIGLAVSLPMMARKRLKRESLIPYGPFLLLACVSIVLSQPVLIGWLKRLLQLS